MNKKIFALFLVGIAVVLFIPIIPIDETYTKTETYNRSLEYKIISAKCKDEIEFPELECSYVSEVILKNIDSHGGTFIVTHEYQDTTDIGITGSGLELQVGI